LTNRTLTGSCPVLCVGLLDEQICFVYCIQQKFSIAQVLGLELSSKYVVDLGCFFGTPSLDFVEKFSLAVLIKEAHFLVCL